MTLRLTGLGVKASWEAPSGSETFTYALYRSELPEILSVMDLTPAAKDISGTSAVDAAPSCRFHTYAVIAVDGVGNESLPSASVYLDFSILPVADLSIFRKGTNPPEISWTYPDGNIAGCDLYIGTGSEMLKVHRSVLSELSYIDTGYSGGERTYTIVTFDDYGREGPARSITLPLLRATLAQGEVRRGLMNRLDFIIENHSSFRAEHVRLKLDISGHNYESEEFSVEGGGTNEISLVVGGHKDLPQSAILSSFIEIMPHEGEKIQIVEENEIEVKEGVPALEVHNEPFVRGGQGRVWFTLENTGDEEIEVIVAEGEEPSPEVSVTLLDPEGNVLSAAPFRQDTGDGLEALSDRTVIARIPGRKVFTFAPVDLHIPSSVPKDILIQPEISQIHYHLGEADHVAIEGVSTRRQISLVDTSYYGEVLSVTPVSSNGNQDITITGRAGQRGTGASLPGVELNLIITSSRGFERVYRLLTGSNGLFSFPFRPCDGDCGRFSVCAMHPDLLDRPVHGEFVINRMHIDPAVIKLNLAKNYQRTMNVRIDAGQETAVHNVRIEYAREDQPEGLFPVGVFVAPGAAIAEIRPDEKGLLNFNIWADSRAQKAARIVLKVMSDESGEEACGFVIIDGCFEDAVPKLYSTPDYVETGVGFGDTVMEKVVLENRGPVALHGVSLDLVLPDGGPAPGWVQLNAARELGEIGPEEKHEVGISFSPSPDKVSEGMHSFYLRVAASNHETTDIGLYATVSRSGIGNVIFKITDIYTGTFDRANEPIRGLAGAMIEIEAEAGSEVLAADTTNALGEALIAGLAVGRYRYRVTADDHLEYSGVFSIKPGIVVHEDIFLESDLVTVSWDLFEVPTQEKYDVRTTTTYRPDAPAAVVVCEPASAKLPLMEPGDVYKGEFTLINKGRIRAYDIRFEPPVDEDLYRFELLEGLPDSLEPGQRFKAPYRATCIRSPFESASGGVGTFPATYYMDTWCMPTIIMPYKYQCMGGGIQCSRAKFIYIQQCWRIAVDVYQYMFMVIEKPRLEPFGRVDIICPREDLCEVQDACCRIGTSEPLEGGGYINLATGKFTDTVTDLSVKARGGQVGVVRVLSDVGWRFEHIDRLALSYDTYLENQVDVIIKGGTFYTRPRTETIIALTAWDPQVWISVVDPNRKIYRMTNLDSDPDHFLWTDISGEWRKYDLSGKLIAYGNKDGLIASLVYKPGVDGELTGVLDRSGNQVLWYECAGMKVLGVSDASGRRVEYVYAGDRLSAAIYQFGDEVHAVHYNSDGSSYEEVDSEGNSRVFAMNEQGEVTGVSDVVGPGPKISYDYDSQRRMKHTRIEYPSGKVKELWYDNAGHRITAINGKVVEEIIVDGRNKTIIDSHQNKIVKAYDEWGNLTRETYEDGSSVSYEYMPTTAYLARKTDEKGIVTLYGYQLIINLFEFRVDARLNRIIEAAGTPNERITEYGYDEWGNQTTIKVLGDAGTPEAVTVMEYDGFGNMVAVTDPEGNTTRFTHDIQGNVITRKDAKEKEWTYEYTLAGRLKSAEDPLFNETRMEYDRVGNKVKDIDAEEKATTYKYDARRRLKEVTDPLGNSTSYGYNEDGQVATVTDPEGRAIRYDYDVEGRLIYTIDGNGNETVMEYGDGTDTACSACGVGSGPKRIIYPTFTREYFYDKRSRKTGETDILNAGQIYLTQFFYDAAGNLIARKDKEERITAYAYDALNRLVKETDPLGGITEYAYDDRDNLIGLKDANGNVTRFEYDRNNRLTKETRPMGQETTYVYDPVGNLISKTDAEGQTTTYEYDDAGRMTVTKLFSWEIEEGERPAPYVPKTVTFSYDKVGSLTGYNDGTTSADYIYDDAHRKISERVDYGPFDLGYSYSYFRNGKKKNFTGADGITYEYTYDGANQLKSVLIPGQGSITYNAYTWARPKTITLPGNSRKEFAYDPLMRIKAITAKDPASHTFMSYGYKYSPMDNVTEKATERGNHIYGYDELYRLTAVDNPALDDEAFTYDPVGNRLTDAATPGLWSYDQNNELLGYGAAVCQYDENGNLIQKADGAEVMNFFYDIENRLDRVEDDGGTSIASYYYDPFGRRLLKDVGGVKTYFLYSDEGLIGEYNASGTEIRSYAYKPDSTWTTDPLFMEQDGQYYFYHNDHLGTPMQLTATNGAIVWSAKYEAFGATDVDPGSMVTNNLRFSGQYYDQETGLHYNCHRDYDSEIGRYVEADPIGLDGGVNLYGYGRSNPISFTDALGLKSWICSDRNIKQFLTSDLIKQFDRFSKTIGIEDENLILALAAWESFWGTSRFARQHNNLFGFGRAATADERKRLGINRVPFTFASIGHCLDRWGREYGSVVSGATEIDNFIYRLQNLPGGRKYNEEDRNWEPGVKTRFRQVKYYRDNCMCGDVQR